MTEGKDWAGRQATDWVQDEVTLGPDSDLQGRGSHYAPDKALQKSNLDVG